MHRHQAGYSRTLRIAGVATALSGLLLMIGGAAQVASADPNAHANVGDNGNGTATGNKFVSDGSNSGSSGISGGISGGSSTGSSGSSGSSGGVSGGSSTGSGGSGSTAGSSGSSGGSSGGLLVGASSVNNNSNPHDTTTTASGPTTSTPPTTAPSGSKGIPNPDFTPDAPSTDQFVTKTTEDCNGIIPTPGSKKERKTLNTSIPSTFDAGSADIHWSVFPYQHPNGGADTLTVHDCVVAYPAGYLVPGTNFDPVTGELLTLDPSVLKKNYTVLDTAEFLDVTLTSHPGSDDTFDYEWKSPNALPAGTVVCNYAKTTGNNSSGDTNRKGGAACIVVPGPPPPNPTTSLPSGGFVPTPTTTTVAPTTTAPAVVLPEVITTTTVPTAVLPEVITRTLPFTGTNSQFPLFAGMTLVIVGLVLVGAARRRDPVVEG